MERTTEGKDREQLFRENLPLVRAVLRDHYSLRQFDDDYYQLGCIGLWKACLTYVDGSGAFSTYAYPCILNELRQHTRVIHSLSRVCPGVLVSLDAPPAVGEAPLSELLSDSGDGERRMEDELALEDLIRGLREQLSDRERLVFDLHYQQGLTQREIGTVLGRSPTTVNRLWQRARAKARKYLRASGFGPEKKN